MEPDKTLPRNFFKLHFLALRFLGVGWWHLPNEGDTRNFSGLYLYYSLITQLVWVVGFVGLETIDPFFGEKDLDRFMFSLSFVVIHDLTFVKLYIFFVKNKDIQDVTRTLEMDLQQFYQNDQKIRATVRTTKILTGALVFSCVFTIASIDLQGAVEDHKWKSKVKSLNHSSQVPPRAFPQPIYIPWSYESDLSYRITFALETLALLWTAHIVIAMDTLVSSLILHMCAQFEILQEAVTTAYDRTISYLYQGVEDSNTNEIHVDNSKRQDIVKSCYPTEEIEAALEKTFKDCIAQHQVLITCTQKFARLYSYGFAVQLVSSMAAICVVMVQLSLDASSLNSPSLVSSLAFFTVMLIELAIQCFTGNELTLQAMNVADSVMNCNWEILPIRVRRLLLFVIMRAQHPIYLTAAGFANMNYQCFLSILKAAYSYYAVLSQRQM